MLVKLIRPLLASGWNSTRLVLSENLSTSSVLFQQSFSGTNSGGSGKPTEKGSNLKNQQQKQQQGGDKNKGRTGSDTEQERSQQEGPADREAERKSSTPKDYKATKPKK